MWQSSNPDDGRGSKPKEIQLHLSQKKDFVESGHQPWFPANSDTETSSQSGPGEWGGDWGIPNLKYDLKVLICQGKGMSPKKN